MSSNMTVLQPWDLPDMPFDKANSEDENFLTWAQALARFSVSRKGHMGALIVRPAKGTQQDGADPSSSLEDEEPFAPDAIRKRIVAYANNTPLLFNPSPKMVQEIHAEALCIASAARRGLSTDGCTIYVTFPPCNECLKSIIAAGIKRCVYRKSIRYPAGEAALCAAATNDVEMCGTTVQREEGMSEEEFLAHLAEEKALDASREKRVRSYWDLIGESSGVTRARVDTWWADFILRNKAAVKQLQSRFGKGSRNSAQSARDARVADASDRQPATQESGNVDDQTEKANTGEMHYDDEDDDDAMNQAAPLPSKRGSTDIDDTASAKKSRISQ